MSHEEKDWSNLHPVSPRKQEGPDQDPFSKAFNEKRFSRRGFIGGVLGSAALLAADRLSGEIMWHSVPTDVKVLGEHQDYYTDEVWVIVTGLGVQSGHGIATVLKPAIEQIGAVSYVQYADDGLDIPALAEHINQLQRQRGFSAVNFYSHSMGGTTTLNLLPLLSKSIEVNRMIFDCSPFTKRDVKRDAFWANVIGHTPEGFKGGFISKLAFEGYNNVGPHSNDQLSLLQQLKEGWRIAKTGVSSTVWLDQMRLLVQSDPDKFRQFVPKGKPKAFIRPYNPNADGTVFVKSAQDGWDGYLGPVDHLLIDGSSHANPTQRPDLYAKTIYNWLYPPPEPRPTKGFYPI